MEKVKVKPFPVNGLRIKTSNATESDPAKAQIGLLWQRYFAACPQEEYNTGPCYGVYANYESDEHGAFDVIAGKNEKLSAKSSHTIEIQEGNYLCFEKNGTLPDVVIELWQEIWVYFQKDGVPQRNFRTDFEEYESEDSVKIYIGILGE